MNRDEEIQRRDGGENDNEERDVEMQPLKSSNHRKPPKYEFAHKAKNSRQISPQNRCKSCRSRSRSRSQLRQTSTESPKKSWKSANAWLNFMQDFRENLRGYPGLHNANVFRLAGKQWSDMTPQQKKPYIDAANEIKRQKELEGGAVQKKQSKMKRKNPKSENALKGSTKTENKRGQENDEETDSESDSENEASTKTVESDNGSVDTDGSI